MKLVFDTRVQAGESTLIEPLEVIPDVLVTVFCSATMHGWPPVPAEVVPTTSLVELALTVTEDCEVSTREMASGTDFCTLTLTALSELDFTPRTIWAVIRLSV
jgi:hypothetical protein